MWKEQRKDIEPQGKKPYIKVHDSDVDFGDVRFHVEVYSDYQWSSLEVINPKGLSKKEIQRRIEAVKPWADKVFREWSLGSWGNALFNPEGMGLIDEVGPTSFWVFPRDGRFRDDTKFNTTIRWESQIRLVDPDELGL